MPTLALLLFAVLLGASPPGLAETRYVTDRLEVALRAREGERARILAKLPSGAAVEVLAVNPASGYVRVRAQDGTLGFVAADRLQPDPAARDLLAEAQRRCAEPPPAPTGQDAGPATLQADLAALQTRYEETEAERRRLEQELARIRHVAANALDIANDRERLRLQVADLIRARADLEQSNRDLVNQANLRWFLAGGAVLVGGVALGLLLPNLRLGRRRSPWSSL